MSIRYTSRIKFLCFTIGVLLLQSATAAPKATKDELNTLAERVAELEQYINSQLPSVASKEGLIALQFKLKAMEKELQEVRGENENLRYELNQLREKQRESFINIDKRLQQKDVVSTSTESSVAEQHEQEHQQVEGITVEQVSANTEKAEARPVDTASGVNDSNKAINEYRNAFLLLKQRKHEEATTAFENFLATHPDSKYAANAQYWIAEASYVTKQYERALIEFQKVLDVYPASSKLLDARLKIGYTQYELGRWEDARNTLTKVRAQFPNSTVAGLAQQRLERLDREGH